MDYLLLLGGLVLLTFGGEYLVRGAVGLARHFKVSPLVIGITVVAWGTSMPELVVSVKAALEGSMGISVGNVVGSNIFNIILILGVTAMISPILCSPRAIYRDGSFALFAALMFILIALTTGVVETWHGLLMLLALAGATYWVFRRERQSHDESAQMHEKEAEELTAPKTLWILIAMTVAGLAALVGGSELLVRGAVSIARSWGVDETIIGLTLVAGGTSLPELAASVVAAIRRHSDVALGNIIGSNIYNIFAILGIASLLGPISIPAQIIRLDMWIMLGATILLFPPLFLGSKIGRLYGAMFFACYLAYVIFLFTSRVEAG